MSRTVRGLAIDAAGRIYVGAVGTFGYLAPDGQRRLAVRLAGRPSARRRADLQRRLARRRHRRRRRISRPSRPSSAGRGTTLTVIKPVSRFNRASVVDGRLYLTMPETGLNVLEGDTFRAAARHRATRARALPDRPAVRRAPAARSARGPPGCSSTTARRSRPFARAIDAVLTGSQLYRGTRLADGTFALTTTAGGLVIIDRAGPAVIRVTRANGLPSDVVYFVMPDREGALWLGLDAGIARVEVPSPVSFFDADDGSAWRPSTSSATTGGCMSPARPACTTSNRPSAGATRRVSCRCRGTRSQCWWFTPMPRPERGRASGADGRVL